MSWLMLPRIVREMTRNLFPSFINNTLPAYSPIRLGVVTENETPERIALNDFKNDTS